MSHLLQFEQACDHYAIGDVVKVSDDEKKRIDDYAEVNGLKNVYKTVTESAAKKSGGSGTVTPKPDAQVDHNGTTVNDPAPQTPLAGDGTVKVQDNTVATGQTAPVDGEGNAVPLTAADKKAAKEAAKRGQSPAQTAGGTTPVQAKPADK